MNQKPQVSRSFAPMTQGVRHCVVCVYCANTFDLFAASWWITGEEGNTIGHAKRQVPGSSLLKWTIRMDQRNIVAIEQPERARVR
jgi:hypothetical protein